MKRIHLIKLTPLIIVILFLSAALLTGCSNSSKDTGSSVYSTIPTPGEQTDTSADNIPDAPFEMEKVGRSTNYGFTYYRDTTTDVLYVYTSSCFTTVLNPETGLPMTYTQYIELSEKQSFMSIG